MKVSEDISGFGSFNGSFGGDGGAVVDFARAKRLERSGSTCEVFETTLQRRRVFVKRLRAEFRDNPQYRAAFDKEFDLGVSLTHPSLPRYVALHDDYIVMDYVEGETLADLIERKDARLRDRKWVRGVLGQLIDVIDYLHHRNVVHCDVKADNVIVSPYADRPVTLIDLDKAYTAWLDGTSGNPAKYDCEDCADGDIDYRGLGKIAEKLGNRQFARICMHRGVSADQLRDALKPDKNPTNHNVRFGIICLCLGFALYYLIYILVSASNEPVGQTASAISDSVANTREAITPSAIIAVDSIADAPAKSDDLPHTSDQVTPKATTESVADKSLDDIVISHYGPLYKRHDYLRALMADSTVTAAMLLDAYRAYADQQMEAQEAIMADIMEKYALPNALEASSILGSSKQWGKFMQADSEINDQIGKAMDDRKATR